MVHQDIRCRSVHQKVSKGLLFTVGRHLLTCSLQKQKKYKTTQKAASLKICVIVTDEIHEIKSLLRKINVALTEENVFAEKPRT